MSGFSRTSRADRPSSPGRVLASSSCESEPPKTDRGDAPHVLEPFVEHHPTSDSDAAFYGDGPRLSYWNGCSTGGRQGLMEALRYPADYDGIIAGAPVNFRTHQLTWELWVSHAVHRDAASYIPPAKYPAIHQAALDACDARDGLRDGLIEEPATCRFDPKVLACTSADSPSCLTPPQVTAAQRIYSPAVNP